MASTIDTRHVFSDILAQAVKHPTVPREGQTLPTLTRRLNSAVGRGRVPVLKPLPS